MGPVGDGFIQSMKILDGGRISIAALSLGVAKGAYNSSLLYSQERKQFGKSISEFQGISFKLVDMATEIEAASLLTQKASEMKNKQMSLRPVPWQNYLLLKLVLKLLVISSNSWRLWFTKDFPVENFTEIQSFVQWEGTSEIKNSYSEEDFE